MIWLEVFILLMVYIHIVDRHEQSLDQDYMSWSGVVVAVFGVLAFALTFVALVIRAAM